MTPTSANNVGVATLQVRDKIAQAYFGLWGDAATQDRARRRLHWLAEHCLGEKVLDIGCSEGMLAVLLAREGFTVTGIDINPDELEYARGLLANERDFVQSRIEFILADVLSANLEEGSYDTVVLGEVIEHLIRPELMIDRALKLTKSGGRLLITTPFGYFPDIDHRQSFVMTKLVEILSSRCKPQELSIKDGYIRIAALNEASQKQDWRKYDLSYLLGLTEKAVVEVQRNLHERINGYKDRQKQQQQQLDEKKQILETSKKTCTELTEKVQALDKAVVVREGEIGRIKKQLDTLQNELDGTLKKTEDLSLKFDLAGKQEQLLLNQVKQIELDKDQLQSKNMQLHESEQRLREKLDEVQSRDEQHLGDYQVKLKELEQMQGWINGLQEDLKRVNQQSEHQNREITLLREQLELAQTENQRTWNELEKRNGEISRLGELANLAQSKAIQLETSLQEREKQLADVNESLAYLTTQAGQYQKECESAEQEIAHYRDLLEAATKRLTAQTEQIELLKAGKAELASALDEAEVFWKSELEFIRESLAEETGRSERLLIEKAELAKALEKAETSRLENEENERLLAQLDDTQELTRKIQVQYEKLLVKYNSNDQLARQRKEEIEHVESRLRQLEEQKQSLEANILERQAETGRLKQGQMRLQNAYDLLAKREYLARIRSQEVEQTIAYRLGIAITQAMAHPGFRSLRRVLGELGQSLTQGRRKMKGTSDCVVMSLDVQMPDGSIRKLTFTCTQPEKLMVTGQQIEFAQPADESVRLIAKPSAKITEAVNALALPLKPDQSYMMSGNFTLRGGRASLHVIEYSENFCLLGRDYPLRTLDWHENWRTHIDHAGLCLAIELQGKGCLTVDQFMVEKTSQRAATTQSLSVDKDKSDGNTVLLSKTPVYFQFKTPDNAMLIVKGRIRFHDEVDRKPGYALALVTYLDHAGKELPGPYKGAAYSSKLGWFSYLRIPENENISSELFRLTPPPEAEQVKFGIRIWNARTPIELDNKIEISEQDLWLFPRFEKPKPQSEGKPVVASILDPFSEECFRYDLNLVALSRESWTKEIEATGPKMLLVESAWQGNSGQWSSVLTQYAKQEDNPLKLLLAYCRKHAIPTVFWNKEDPPNFDVFIDAARDFDIIFTTDQNCIPEYRKRCGHDRVYCLPFAAQPAIHNPIGKQEVDDYDIAFAGTWYKRKHPERSELLPNLLDPASKYHLYIFDRMSDWLYDDSYQYPEQYKPFLNHKISYEEILYVHRSFKLVLNTNSVINSPTMFSRRVFEILASSTPVVSTASKGVQEMFGDLVPVVVGQDQAKKQIELLMDNAWYRKQLGHLGYRHVMLEHTVDKRVREIFSRAGLDGLKLREEFPKVTLAVATNRPEHLDKVKENFERQNYPNLELVLVLNCESFDKAAVIRQFASKENVKVFQLPSVASLGECLNKAIDESTGAYWAKMDDDNIYLENYITDLMLPFRYSEADVVGKTTHFLYMERTGELMLRFPEHEHNYEDVVNGGTLLVKRSVFERVRFAKTSVGEDSQFLSECLEQGLRVYAADCFNCVIIRKADTHRHTWQIEETELLRHCQKISDGLHMEFVDPNLGIKRPGLKMAQSLAPSRRMVKAPEEQAQGRPPAGQNSDLANTLDPETINGIMKTFGQDVFTLNPFMNGADDTIRLTNTEATLQLFSSADAYHTPVKGQWMYQFQGLGYCSNGKFEKSGLIQFIFLDKFNRIIDEHYPFSSFSKNYRNFKYLRVAPDGADNEFEIVTPTNAVTMIAGFRQFHPEQPSEVSPVWHLRNQGKFISPDDFAQDYDCFFNMSDNSKSDTVVFLFSSTKSIGMSHRGNRPMRFARMIADRGIPIIYNYYRWRSSADIVRYDGSTLFQSPIDVTAIKMVDIATHHYPQKRKIFLLSMPNSDAVKYLGLFKEYGWTVIYECRDDWEEFWKVGVGKWYHPLLEQYVTAKSDGVTTVSCTLRDKMNQWRLPGSLPPRIIPNGLDPSFTRQSVHEFIEQRQQKAPGQTVIGYHGHLTGAWFDWDLIIETAKEKTDWRFEIIGFDAPSDLDLPGNVVYMGPKSHEEIQAIALGWTVSIIPFKPTKLAEGVDPIKVYEYLAMGLPVVSVHMPQILEYPCVRCYKDGTQFMQMLEDAILAPFKVDEVEEWLKKRTWEDRIDETFAFADELSQNLELKLEMQTGTKSVNNDLPRARKASTPENTGKKLSRKQKKCKNK